MLCLLSITCLFHVKPGTICSELLLEFIYIMGVLCQTVHAPKTHLSQMFAYNLLITDLPILVLPYTGIFAYSLLIKNLAIRYSFCPTYLLKIFLKWKQF